MSSPKIYPFSTLQLRLVNQLILRGSTGRKTNVLAAQAGCSPSEVAFELLKLRERGYVSTVHDDSPYVTWYSSPGLVDALQRYTASKVHFAFEKASTTPEPTKPERYRVFGPAGSRYVPSTYATEAAAMREATKRAKDSPGSIVEVYALHKSVLQKPEKVIPGELIVE